MGHDNKKYGATVVHQDAARRDASVGSWASRSSYDYQSPSSDSSSESSYVWEGHYRDPESSKKHPSLPCPVSLADSRVTEGNMKTVTERRTHKGGKVVVVNHRKGNKESGPTPSYSDASGYGRSR